MPGDADDPLGLRSGAPALDAYLSFLASGATPFTIPGHKGRTDLVGTVVRGDVPLHGGLDTVRLSGGVLARAERLAADLWGADWCRFSVGGATHGNQALALAIGRPGDEVVVARTLHRSMLVGLVLAGLRPVWVHPDVDEQTGLPGGVPPAAVADALAAHPQARAVLVGDPSYTGGFGDLGALASVAHRHGIPLVVDAAWAPHFGFHPAVPQHALAQGADAMVTSAHKALPAISQAAIVVARTGLLDHDRLERAFEAANTTSPAGAILASIDASRALLERHGHRLVGRLVDLVASARDRLTASGVAQPVGGPHVDPTKLVVQFHASGASGYDVEATLLERGMPVEMADVDTLIPMVTIADDTATVGALVDGIIDAAGESSRRAGAAPRAVESSPAWTVSPDAALTPREAFFATHVTMRADDAVGHVSAEIVAPYPPGIPVLAPGERIGRDTLDALRWARSRGARVAYAADPTLATLQVVDPSSVRGNW